jgi:hypothetical protein
MGAADLQLSRISKLLLDRDQVNPDDVLARRQGFTVELMCGEDVAGSATLQVAVLTAAAIAVRCFPGAVRAAVPPKLATAPLRFWPVLGLSFGGALADILGPGTIRDRGSKAPTRGLVFGNAPTAAGALRVTFDGWIAKAGPAAATPRLREREYCSLSGVLAAALAVSELFLGFAGVSVEATRRIAGLSLWRPDLGIDDGAALGIPVEYLPRDLWVLGLGHLGNAYVWTLASLPYPKPHDVEFALCDFDRIEPENVETGVIFTAKNKRKRKTRAACLWLGQRGFETLLLERRFDATFRRHEREPGLALCGFDSNPARRDLGTAQFLRLVEAGLGGTASNFDTISLHTLPNPRAPAELWPDLDEDAKQKRAAEQERMARENPAYAGLGRDACGRFDLAGKSVAVPFVGVAAASLVVAEVLRLLHGGPAFTDLKFSLGMPGKRAARLNGNYDAQDAAGLKFVSVNLPTT